MKKDMYAVAKDITAHKRLEEELTRRDRILDAVRFAAQELLNLDDWGKKAQEVLRLLGEAAGVSRVYIFEKHLDKGGKALLSRRYEWTAPGVASRTAAPEQGLGMIEGGFGRWLDVMNRGEAVWGHVREFAPSERAALCAQGILSVVAVPVYDSGALWGFAGFDECVREREWSASELSALRAAAGIFGAAVTQRRVTGAGRGAGHRYHEFLESSPLGVFTFDSSGVINGCNKKFLEIIGATKEKLIGFDMLANVKNEAMRAAIEKALHARTGYYEGEYVSVTGGKKTDVRVNLGPVHTRDGTFIGGGGIVEDVTEIKRTENELNKYRSNLEAIFRSVNDAIITVDMDLTVTEVNDAARVVCGLSRDAIGKKLSEYLDTCFNGCMEVLRESIAKKDRVEVYRRRCRKGGGASRCLTLTSDPLCDGKGAIYGAVLVVRDETRLTDLESNLTERRRFRSIVGRSRKMSEVFHLIESLADIQSTVIITGESGTGKELAAEALHYSGVRRDRPFVKVNCAGLPEQLLESELFGHVKGAFTGAVRDRIGRFQLADGGTIFLDEIGEISHNVQLRLLRVLQNSEFERVGDSDTVKVDIRVVAATNKDLQEKVKRGDFREDLYYRLKVMELALPPLRERMEDMPLLVEHFLEKLNKKFSKGITAVCADVQRILMEHSWPGNIRELEHALEHAFILCRDDTIEIEHLPASLRNLTIHSRGYYHKEKGADEAAAISNALERTAWNKSKAARLLGMNRRTLYRKIAQYDIPADNGDA